MAHLVIFNVNRSVYSPLEAAEGSMTVGELINRLRTIANEDDKVIFSNDRGYTYGYIDKQYVKDVDVNDEDDEVEDNE